MRVTSLICLTLLCFLSWVPTTSAQQDGLNTIQPIKMGDSLPDSVWNWSFQIVKHDEKPKTIRMNDYRGKTIILDFWATWCKGCILSMPKMHELAAAYPEDVVLLPVTYEDADLILEFLDKSAAPQIRERKEDFKTIVQGQPLKDLIPHNTIPRIAVINSDGILEQITMPHLLTNEILGKMVRQEQYYMPKYRGDLGNSSILSPTYTDIKAYKTTFYTALTGELDGFNHSSKKTRDTLNGVIAGHYVNNSLFQLFHIAVKPVFNPRFPNRRIMLMEDPSQLDFFRERNPEYNSKKFNFSYEYLLPIYWSDEQIRKRMRRDLEDYSGYHVKIIQREVPCIVIRSSYGTSVPKTSYPDISPHVRFVKKRISQGGNPEEIGLSKGGFQNYLRNSPVSELVFILNDMKETAVPFVIDETGIDYKIDLDLPDNLGDVVALKDVLGRQGLEVVIEERMMEMFVLSDAPIFASHVTTIPLQLTKFGFTSKDSVK